MQCKNIHSKNIQEPRVEKKNFFKGNSRNKIGHPVINVFRELTKALVPSGPLSEVLITANPLHLLSMIWTYAKVKVRLCWITLCSSDNDYNKNPKLSDSEGLFCKGHLTEKELFDATKNIFVIMSDIHTDISSVKLMALLLLLHKERQSLT